MRTIVFKKDEAFEELKRKMSESVNVTHWNQLREEAKKTYPMETINKLDASAYISEVLQ